MDALYVALSAQVALEAKLDSVAQNVANLATAGYRADEIKFDAVMSKTAADSVAFASCDSFSYSARAAMKRMISAASAGPALRMTRLMGRRPGA